MPKKKAKTTRSVLEGLEELQKNCRCSFEAMKRQFSSLVRQHKETDKAMIAHFTEQTKLLKQLAGSNENVSDTLLNVLLAIRQNEYLQAWYPAQHGFPEMKVSGSHPAKLMKVKDGQGYQIGQEIA